MGDPGPGRVPWRPLVDVPFCNFFLSLERVYRQGKFLSDAPFDRKVLIRAPSPRKYMTMFVL